MGILNPHNDPYLVFAEQQRRLGKRQFSPWTTRDPELLNLAKDYFPEIPIVASDQLEKPDMTAIPFLPLSSLSLKHLQTQEAFYLAVGGPPAAAVALQHALDGKAVMYISDLDLNPPGKTIRPIWAGAGNHGEPDALTEAPAYVAGHQPIPFILKEIFRFFVPGRFDKSVLSPDYPWLNLNFSEWLKNPRQWLAGFRVAWGNHCLSKKYRAAKQQGNPKNVLQAMKHRAQESGAYLEALQQQIGGLIREPRGSLLVATTEKQWEKLLKDQEILRAEGRDLHPLSNTEVEQKYGILPRHALGLMEKTHDFIFEPDFLKKISTQILAQGGQVITTWRLSRVYLDTETKNGGVLEFYERGPQQEKIYHYRKFVQAHLSLGPTPFHPNIYDLISVTGVSMNALIIGANLKGGPIVCGGTNHVVPLLPPREIALSDAKSGEKVMQTVTFARLSAAASVSPGNRGKAWYTYDGRHAVHLLHRIRETLPENVQVKLLSVVGCNRVIGKDGQQVELHPTLLINDRLERFESVTIQIGAGGGGLTQMGAVPKKLLKI